MTQVRGVPRRALALVAAVVATLATVVGPIAAVGAQASPDVEVTGIDVSDFPTVRLRFALAPGIGADGLDAAAIDLTENGEPIDEDTVTPLAGQALSVLLAIDTSGSMAGEPLDQAKVASQELLDTLPDDAEVAVIDFGREARLASAFTTDRDATSEAIDALEAPGGATLLYDAVALGAEQAAASTTDRSALILLTDGADAGSETDLAGAQAALADSDADFFAISLQTEDSDAAALDDLAEAAGGRVVNAADPEDLAAAYVELGQRIVNQYQIEFTSTTEDATATYAIGVAGAESPGTVELALPGRGGTVTTAPPSDVALPDPIVVEASPGPLQQDWVLFVGAGLVGLAIAVTAVILAQSSSDRPRTDRRRSLRTDAEIKDGANVVERAVATARAAATRITTRAVDRTESGGAIDAKLDRAGLIMRAGEFVATVIAVALAAGVLGYLLLGPVGLAVGVLVPILGANTFLGFRASRRNQKFSDQLSDTLLIMAGSLRSGFGVGQAIDTVAEEMDSPMSDEFRRAILETRLGRDIEDALDGISKRVQNEDFEWVVDAMRINRQVGGDLASILDQVSETIRSRNRLKRQVAALTAEGRISALVLFLLPIGLGLVLYSSNPDYMNVLFTRTAGQIALGFAVVLLAAGGLWLKKMIDIEY